MLLTPTTFTPLMTLHGVDIAPLDPVFVIYRGQLLLGDALALPGGVVLDALQLTPERVHAVGKWQDKHYRMAWTDSDALPGPGYAWHGLRSLFGSLDEGLLALAGRAVQLAEWARTHRYCGVCATPMQRKEGERCYACPQCGMTAYPRISPAMMVLIRRGDSVLLALHKGSPYQRFTPLAGFLEAGESVEEAVHREVFEEVGLKVGNLAYFASQSWPFPHSLMLAFTADYVSGEIRVDADEISEARWFGPDDEWPERIAHISISTIMIDAHRPDRA